MSWSLPHHQGAPDAVGTEGSPPPPRSELDGETMPCQLARDPSPLGAPCLSQGGAHTHGMDVWGHTDTEEWREMQVCYLSQSEGEDLARRPCRTRGCPRHEGTQGLRSLWAKRTELLRAGRGQGGEGRAHRWVTSRCPRCRPRDLGNLCPLQDKSCLCCGRDRAAKSRRGPTWAPASPCGALSGRVPGHLLGLIFGVLSLPTGLHPLP